MASKRVALNKSTVWHCCGACAVSTVACQDALFSSLDCDQFSHALSMCGLGAFAKRGSRLQQGANMMQAPEQQLAAFLTFMGLEPLPGHQQLAAQQAAGSATAAAAAAGGKRGSQRHIGSGEFCCSAMRRLCWLAVN